MSSMSNMSNMSNMNIQEILADYVEEVKIKPLSDKLDTRIDDALNETQQMKTYVLSLEQRIEKLESIVTSLQNMSSGKSKKKHFWH